MAQLFRRSRGLPELSAAFWTRAPELYAPEESVRAWSRPAGWIRATLNYQFRGPDEDGEREMQKARHVKPECGDVGFINLLRCFSVSRSEWCRIGRTSYRRLNQRGGPVWQAVGVAVLKQSDGGLLDPAFPSPRPCSRNPQQTP